MITSNISDRNLIIARLYQQGLSSGEIVEQANFGITIRQIQRIIKQAGITRDQSTAFQMAVDKKRVTYHHKPTNELKARKRLPSPLRMKILKRDNFTCQLCGATSRDDRIQVDHKDEDATNNDESNLWVLCETCNKGKHFSI